MRSVLVFDPVPLVLSGVESMLQGAFRVTTAHKHDELEQALVAKRPDVFVFGLYGSINDDVRIKTFLEGLHKTLPFLIISDCGDVEHIRTLILLGGKGYVSRQSQPHVLLQAVHLVSKSGIFIDPTINEQIWALAALTRTDPPPARALPPDKPKLVLVPDPASPTLTPREDAVIRLTAYGQSTKQIAHLLTISAKTVEKHRTNAMTKLGLHTRSDLVALAARYGWINPADQKKVG